MPPPRIAEGQEVFGRSIGSSRRSAKGEWARSGRSRTSTSIAISALKLIKPEIAQNDKGWKRFRREAQLMAKLEHPNAVAVYDFRRSHSMGYIEMEFVRGQSLDKYLKEHKGGTIPLDWIADLLDQLCAVLQEAHGHVDEKSGKPKPIIHRDLKPSNLMLVDRKPQGQNLKVLDFGIAKMIESEGSHETTLTGAGDFMGTPAYMSPEQIRGGWGKEAQREIDGRSDLYSVGVLLYQLLTGKLPFRRGDFTALLAAHLTQQPRPMKEANPKVNVPPAVERVVMQCLEKDPERRPQSAQELARMFRAAAGLSAQPTGGANRFLWPVIAAACIGLVGLGAWVALRHPGSPGGTGGNASHQSPRVVNVTVHAAAANGARSPMSPKATRPSIRPSSPRARTNRSSIERTDGDVT